MNILNTVLNDAGWWFESLAEEFGHSPSQLARMCPHGTSDGTLRDLAEAFTAYDARLVELGSAVQKLDPIQVRNERTYLGALKKFSPTDSVPNVMATHAALGFSMRNAEAANYYVPRRYLPFIRTHIQHALRHYADARESVKPRFGPGAVLEGWSSIARWRAVIPQALSLGFDALRLDYVPSCDRGASLGVAIGPAKLQAVAKDWDKARLITVEAAFLTYVQQLARSAMLDSIGACGALRHMAVGITDVQARHRQLALVGSRTGELSTLDMTDASDRISWRQVIESFPCSVVSDLEFARSAEYRDTNEPVPLNIYAGMGNATTFTVMTLLFWATCHAIADYHRLGRRYVSVFGDDIVTDWRLAKLIFETEAFQAFGWAVNPKKSMWLPDTYYRESCGCQALAGHDVTLTRVFGYRNTCKGVLGVSALIRRLSTLHPFLAERVWRETYLPNVPNAPVGSASVDLCWCERSACQSRYSKRYQRTELKLRKFVPDVVRAQANRTEYVFGAIAGLLETETRKRGGNPFPPVTASVPRRGKMEEKWLREFVDDEPEATATLLS